MSKKPKFKPEITRVRLNPEQAVLACACWEGTGGRGTSSPAILVCDAVDLRTRVNTCRYAERATSS